jgi:hypothetical protein
MYSAKHSKRRYAIFDHELTDDIRQRPADPKRPDAQHTASVDGRAMQNPTEAPDHQFDGA